MTMLPLLFPCSYDVELFTDDRILFFVGVQLLLWMISAMLQVNPLEMIDLLAPSGGLVGMGASSEALLQYLGGFAPLFGGKNSRNL